MGEGAPRTHEGEAEEWVKHHLQSLSDVELDVKQQ